MGHTGKTWACYPLGTKAYHFDGGYWEKVSGGWKWCNGATFPTPGAEVSRVVEPTDTAETERG